MFQGALEAIFIAERKTEAPRRVAEVEAVAGLGLVGDRYYLQQGTFSKPNNPANELTLIELETIEALEREYQVVFELGESRRNLVTRGVPLNHLVGREFKAGEVVLRGIRLCEPCAHLEQLTREGAKEYLLHRGGLRAQIVSGGLLREGDLIRPSAD